MKTWLFLALVAMLPAQGMAEAGRADWEFRVLLNDKEIGFHRFSLSSSGDRQVLETEASFDVRILFINAFRYRHRNTEIWEGGCLSSIDAVTDNNGDSLTVSGSRAAERFEVLSRRGSEKLSGCVRSFAYWNPDVLQSTRLLNSQTGEYEDIAVAFEGDEAIRVGDEVVDAMRYRLSASGGDIRLWYSTDSRWLALEAPAKGGRTLRYQAVSVPDGSRLRLSGTD